MNYTTRSKIQNLILFIVGIILIGVILQIMSFIENDAFVFPNVGIIIKDFFLLFGKGETYLYILTTLLHLVIAFTISFIIGFILGMIAGFHKSVEQVLRPIMILFRSIPIIVLIVIIMFLMKFIYAPVVSAVLILIPIIYEEVKNGIKNIDSALTDVYKMNSNFNMVVLTRVHIPLIASNIKTAISTMVGMGIKIVVATEYLCGINNTLGKAIILSVQNLEYDYVYAYSVIMILLVILVEWIPIWIAKLIGKIIFRDKKEIEIISNSEEIIEEGE